MSAIHATCWNDCHPIKRADWLKAAARYMVSRGVPGETVARYTMGVNDFEGDGRDTPSSYGQSVMWWEGIAA